MKEANDQKFAGVPSAGFQQIVGAYYYKCAVASVAGTMFDALEGKSLK